MRLTELEPKFLKWSSDRSFGKQEVIEGADGVMFLCPKCFEMNKGPVGTHVIICWAPHVPLTVYPAPGRWAMNGSGYENLSLVASPTSVEIKGGCCAHFIVSNGEIRNA